MLSLQLALHQIGQIYVAKRFLTFLVCRNFQVQFNIIKYKYIKEFHFCVIYLAKKFASSMIIRIFAPSVLAKPLNNAQIVRGVFCLYTFEYGESYSLYKTV